MRVARLLADRGGGLEADEEEDPEEHPAEDAPARQVEEPRLAGVEDAQRDPVGASLRDDHDREDQHRHERDRGEREHRADRDADADVVEGEHDRERDQPPDPPGRAVVGDVGVPEALGEVADAEVDPAAAEEEGAEEEDPGREDADPRVRAVGQVLVDGAGAGEAARVERDDVADREHAEARQQDRERGVPPGAGDGVRDQAEQQRRREHRPDRERLGDGVERREVSFPERPGLAAGLRLAHAVHPPQAVRRPLRRGRGGYKGSNIECQP